MRLAAAMALVALLAGGTAHAQEPTNRVQVRNNVFAPVDIGVRPGQTITWTLVEGKHTVTSDVAKRFDSGVMERSGQTFTFAAPRANVTLYYHCRIHGIGGEGERWGSGMVGRIVVGVGSPAPVVGSDVELRRVPSRRWPTIDAGLASLEPDRRYRIELARGTYRPRDITRARLGFKETPDPRFELTIRGAGARPTDVVFEGAESLGMSVDGLNISNVSFRKQSFAALFVRGIDRWSVDDVVVSDAGRYGVWVQDAHHGRLRRVSISGAAVAGVAVSGCDECDVLVDSIAVQNSLQGLSAVGAGSVVVRGSTFRNNGVGIALKSSPGDGALHRGAHIFVNTFRHNLNRRIEPPPVGSDKDLPVGAGIWIDGGSFDVVEHNDFDGHSFGVVLTGPSSASRIVANTVAGSVEADLAWDGVGANVCFSDNVTPAGEPPTTMPVGIQELYACSLPATVGVPYPPVTATVSAWGLGVRDP